MTELNQTLERLKPTVDQSDPLFGRTDQGGAVQYARLVWDAQNRIRQAIDSGQDPEKAVQGFTDPHNPRGLYSVLPGYQHSQGKGAGGMARVISSLTSGNPQALPSTPGGVHAPAQPPINPGESTSAYLKRIGK